MRRALAFLLQLALLTVAGPLLANPCLERHRAWAERCRAEQGVVLEPQRCPGGRLIARVVPEGAAAFEVDIAPVDPRSFRKARGLGIAPIGEFSNWNAEPAPRRAALERVVRCVEAEPPEVARVVDSPRGGGPSRDGQVGDSGAHRTAPAPVPWLLLAALVIGVGALLGGRRPSRRLLGELGLGLGLGVLGALLRPLLVPRTWLHQNGQGPLWVQYALDGQGSPYGPGYAELFGRPARWFAGDPERGIFLMQSALGGLGIAAAYGCVRAAGGRPLLAAACALGLAADPWLARAAQSESYFGVAHSLALGAAALLALGSRRPRARPVVFAASVLAAGLLVAAVARTHPVTWLSLALLPLVVLAVPGRARTRARWALLAAAGIGVVVSATALPAMLAVLRGQLGQQWVPAAGRPIDDPWSFALQLAAGLALLTLPGAFARRLGALLLLVPLVSWLNVLGDPAPWITRAAHRLALPVLLVAAAALLRPSLRALARLLARIDVGAREFTSPRGRALALGAAVTVAALAVAHTLRSLPTARVLPADVQEAAWVRGWRGALGGDVDVLALERAERRVQVLPLHGVATQGVRHRRFSAGNVPELPGGRPEFFYLRGTLCFTPEGAEACRALERSLELTPRWSTTLEPTPSMRHTTYLPEPLTVTLFQARRR